MLLLHLGDYLLCLKFMPNHATILCKIYEQSYYAKFMRSQATILCKIYEQSSNHTMQNLCAVKQPYILCKIYAQSSNHILQIYAQSSNHTLQNLCSIKQPYYAKFMCNQATILFKKQSVLNQSI